MLQLILNVLAVFCYKTAC